MARKKKIAQETPVEETHNVPVAAEPKKKGRQGKTKTTATEPVQEIVAETPAKAKAKPKTKKKATATEPIQEIVAETPAKAKAKAKPKTKKKEVETPAKPKSIPKLKRNAVLAAPLLENIQDNDTTNTDTNLDYTLRDSFIEMSQFPFELRYKGVKIYDSNTKGVVLFEDDQVLVNGRKYIYSALRILNK